MACHIDRRSQSRFPIDCSNHYLHPKPPPETVLELDLESALEWEAGLALASELESEAGLALAWEAESALALALRSESALESDSDSWWASESDLWWELSLEWAMVTVWVSQPEQVRSGRLFRFGARSSSS
jgi:hypothetical protein